MRQPIVLFVDDDELILRSTVRALRAEPIDLRPIATAREAIEVATNENVAVLIFDLGLAEMNGGELARRIRRLRPDVALIQASGYDNGAVLDVYAALVKPWTSAQLREAIRGAVGLHRSRTVSPLAA
jgi:DNA-binding response OmpR family regulator